MGAGKGLSLTFNRLSAYLPTVGSLLRKKLFISGQGDIPVSEEVVLTLPIDPATGDALNAGPFLGRIPETVLLTVTGDGATDKYDSSVVPPGELWEYWPGTASSDDVPGAANYTLGTDDGNNGQWTEIVTGDGSDTDCTVTASASAATRYPTRESGADMVNPHHWATAGERLTLKTDSSTANTKIVNAYVRVVKHKVTV